MTLARSAGRKPCQPHRRPGVTSKSGRVGFPGVHGKVPGNIAWAPTTQAWLPPMLPVYGGVLGAQDVIPCKA